MDVMIMSAQPLSTAAAQSIGQLRRLPREAAMFLPRVNVRRATRQNAWSGWPSEERHVIITHTLAAVPLRHSHYQLAHFASVGAIGGEWLRTNRPERTVENKWAAARRGSKEET
jgi:hypothetical protein